MDVLESTRRLVARSLFQENEFPREMVGTGGWEYDGLRTFNRSVFLYRSAGLHPFIAGEVLR